MLDVPTSPSPSNVLRRLRLAALAGCAAAVTLSLAAPPASAFVPPAGGAITAAATPGQISLASGKHPGVLISAGALAHPKGAKPVKATKVPAYRSPNRIIATARRYDGGYYRSGGTTPSGFDCSGYTRYVFAKLGRSLPHNSAAQYGVVRHLARSDARPGDLIFFRSSSGHIYHVGIYAGHGSLYHASEPGRRTGLGAIFSSNVSFGRA